MQKREWIGHEEGVNWAEEGLNWAWKGVDWALRKCSILYSWIDCLLEDRASSDDDHHHTLHVLQVQRNLQLRIEAQGKYLQQIIEEQQRLSALTSTPVAATNDARGESAVTAPALEMPEIGDVGGKLERKSSLPDAATTPEVPCDPAGSLVPTTQASRLSSEPPQTEYVVEQEYVGSWRSGWLIPITSASWGVVNKLLQNNAA